MQQSSKRTSTHKSRTQGETSSRAFSFGIDFSGSSAGRAKRIDLLYGRDPCTAMREEGFCYIAEIASVGRACPEISTQSRRDAKKK
jgi:hypothetical protein